jgi:hypothetical protein
MGIPSRFTKLGKQVLAQCSSLPQLAIPASVTAIGNFVLGLLGDGAAHASE